MVPETFMVAYKLEQSSPVTYELLKRI